MMNPTEIQKLKAKAPLPFIITLIMYLAPGFILVPQFENLAITEASADASLKAAAEAIAQRSSDLVLMERHAKLASESRALDAWLPPESELPTLIDRISETASQLGIELSTVQYETDRSTDTPLPPRVMIRFNLRADYVGIRSFLQAVKAIPMPLLITEVSATEQGNFAISLMELVQP
ncbi:MAG TPA: type 4a pilus biogenesis protein PilO [Candidatus Ozemobacteraceae bacterium]|jgi:Tfp pilus assembly protein PilO